MRHEVRIDLDKALAKAEAIVLVGRDRRAVLINRAELIADAFEQAQLEVAQVMLNVVIVRNRL